LLKTGFDAVIFLYPIDVSSFFFSITVLGLALSLGLGIGLLFAGYLRLDFCFVEILFSMYDLISHSIISSYSKANAILYYIKSRR
jgi:hypothetical protein